MFAKEIVAALRRARRAEAEMEKASTERKAKIQARVQETKRKLQSKRRAQGSIDAVKREGDAGAVESLQKQIASAHEDRKERLRERQARTRAEYQARTAP